MFSATCEVLINIVDDGVTYASRGDADATYEAITSFEYVFVLHLMKNIMAITNLLSLAYNVNHKTFLMPCTLFHPLKYFCRNER